MRAFHADPRLAGVRAVHAENLIKTMQIAARAASWDDSSPDPRATCRPTRARITELAGYCVSTWKACRKILQAWGWLGTVREGRSEEARLKSEQPELHYEGNDAAVYVLAIPRSPPAARARKTGRGQPAATASRLTRPPTDGADLEGVTPGPRVDDGEGQEPGGTALRADSSSKPAVWLAIQARCGLKNLSDRAVLRAWRPFRARGWSMAEWLRAIDERPDGRRHVRRPSEIRYPASWLNWRLKFWRGPDGRPLPPPSMQAAVRRLAERREREQHQAAEEQRAGAGITARTRAASAPPGSHIDQLRAERGWKRNGRISS